MERIADGKSPLLFGDGAQTMDFVHVHDIARANILAAKAPVTDTVYNIASSKETSLKELALALLAAMDSDLPLEHGPERKVNGVTRRLADISAAATDLGWKPEIEMDGGLRDLVAWWRAEKQNA
jgi:UDP-glucose 4-epimerase